ncbi:MAG: nitrous oxide reductase family maturation protein NosD [Candidatus Omnitrophica bacterium]|nr:nitrous oxide reductase family maturation protein NosD [Candidatus Omnitrophota bacterium]
MPIDQRPIPRAGGWGRGVFLLAAALLIASAFHPYWRMRVSAPQYPKGLHLIIYVNRLEGDVREIDSLNHYIGMRALAHGAKVERAIAIPGLILAVLGLLLAAAVRRRWGRLGALPTLLLPPVFAADLLLWMRDYGLNLDPKAPLNRAVKPFVPKIVGEGTIAQFHSSAGFDLGFWLAAGAAGLVLAALWLTWARGGSSRRTMISAGVSLALILGGSEAWAKTLTVSASSAPTLAAALDAAEDGDTIVVEGGVHAGPVIVQRSVTLIGRHQPVIDGGGAGTVVELAAPKIRLSGFTIRRSGDLLAQGDTGILVRAPEAVVEDNQLDDVLFGISLRRAPGAVIRRNQLRSHRLAVARRGDLIKTWYSDDVTIADNRIDGGRDLVLWYSRRIRVLRNNVRRGRYGLHFMYCNDADVRQNRLEDNSVGVYLMYSRGLRLSDNRITRNRGPSGFGLGLKDMEDTRIDRNLIADNRVGVFLEHAAVQFTRNVIGANDIGLRLVPSGVASGFSGNSFMDNGEQVSVDGESDAALNRWDGNFWSDYRGFDADGDGIGDVPYRHLRLFERLADAHPALRLYAGSPAATAIDAAAALFPIFAPRPMLADLHPRMRPMPAAPAP